MFCVGCGAYCDNNAGAVSTTGHGESIMKVTLARDIIYNMQQGKKLSHHILHVFAPCQNIGVNCYIFFSTLKNDE